MPPGFRALKGIELGYSSFVVNVVAMVQTYLLWFGKAKYPVKHIIPVKSVQNACY